MEVPLLQLASAPIVEAVVDIDCDMPDRIDFDILDEAARAALAQTYPVQRRRWLSEHVLPVVGQAELSGQMGVRSRQVLQALQYLTQDERQLIQFRPGGYSFNRLAPYESLDQYLAEVQRGWLLFVQQARPLLPRLIRLRYINRINLPLAGEHLELGDYLTVAPPLPDEGRLSLDAFVQQQAVHDQVTGNRANIMMASQPEANGHLPIIFDIEAHSPIDCEPSDWPKIAAKITTLRELKNLVFKKSLTPKCLSLFQR